MKVTQLRINGMDCPMGFSFDKIVCSWKAEDAKSKRQTGAKITVATDATMKQVVYKKSGKNLLSRGEVLDIELSPMTRYYYMISVTGDAGESAKSEVAWFETGKMGQKWKAKWITPQKEDEFHPEFAKDFSVDKKIAKARLYVSGLAIYEAYLNDEKVGEDYLAPFTSDYSQKIQYQTYDVTDQLKQDNALRIICGNGWYKGRLGYEGHVNVYGDRFAAIAELHIWYEDGKKEVIITDDTWNYRGSDIEFSDLYDGEVLNHLLWDGKKNDFKPVEILKKDMKLLVERDSVGVRAHETMKVQEIIRTPKGDTVLDFGQNFAGYVSFCANFKAGTKIVLDFGEILQDGEFYNDNYRTAKAQYVYVSDGRKEIVRPHFTFYGFRYVRVTGWEGEISADVIEAKALYSQLDVTGNITTSNEKINRLFLNCMWGQKSNFIDIPTDCPQRDERLGWTGDAQLFTPTASFNMDTRAFYAKFLEDLHIEQKKWGGAVANYIPNYSNVLTYSSVWGDSAVFIPTTLYKYYGDKEQLRRNYTMMKMWVDFITSKCEENGNPYLYNFGMQFGDWLAMDGATEQSFKGGTDDGFVASIYFYSSMKKTAEAAKILGYKEDAREYRIRTKRIYKAILEEYFTPSGRLCVDTQAAYLISLRFGVYRKREVVVEALKTRLFKDCYRIKCGFVGAPVMCQVLADNGMVDLAYRILFFEGFPGWLHCINLGATTIWERWNSVLDDGHISGTNMNSLNHYSYGSVVEFLYCFAAGIKPAAPGFSSVTIAPKPNYHFEEVDCTYDSVSGKYRVKWKLQKNGKIDLMVEVPFNCTATLELPGTSKAPITLEAGVHKYNYEPETDYRQPYNEFSTLEEMKGSEKVAEILQKNLPIAYGMMMGEDKENLALSLSNMMWMDYMGFEREMVQKTIEKVKAVRV